MPIYEYECRKCGHRFEMLQKVADSPLTKCVQCGGRVDRLLSSPAIQFKGSGWYVTDYARKGQDSSEKSNSGKATEKTSKSTSTESTSEPSRKGGPAASASSTTKD